MEAYLDDYGKITIFMDKNYYGGKSDFFTLIAKDGKSFDLVVCGVEEQYSGTIYHMSSPSLLCFQDDYVVRCSQGYSVPLQIRLIVKTKRFNEEFAYYGDDLGATYSPEKTSFAVWAPTAVQVILVIEHLGRAYSFPMEYDDSGVYRKVVEMDLKNASYVYYIERNGEVVKSLDPYSLSSFANSQQSAIIDPTSLLHRPKVTLPLMQSATDAIIYEANIRDLTSSLTVPSKTKGKFSSLCEKDLTFQGMPAGLAYLKSLGITHLQVLPVLDFATVDEFRPEKFYNWGYDPRHFLCLDGSFSEHPEDPYARMEEFRTLVDTLHQEGIRLNMDVVFNHVYDVHQSPFHTTLPYYYFRYTPQGFLTNGSYCGNDFASEMPMARKYLVDVTEKLIQLYDVDGFRYDLMGLLDVDTMNAIHTKATSLKKDIMMYGEGWDMPTQLQDQQKAKIDNQSMMVNIGHFNDYFRDIIKGKTSDSEIFETGYVTGDGRFAFETLAALGANVLLQPHYTRFDSPQKSINGVETHDNHTVWDKMHRSNMNEDRQLRKKRQKMMIGFCLFAQGVPFIHMGLEYCGTKKDHSNSYNAGDSINQMNMERVIFYQDVLEYFKQCVQFRKKYACLRLKDAYDVQQQVSVFVAEDGVVVYDMASDKDGQKHLIIRFNPSPNQHTLQFEEDVIQVFDQQGMMEQPTRTIIENDHSIVAYIQNQ